LKKIIPFIIILLSLSGCITQFQQPSELVTIPNYKKNDILENVQFNTKANEISLSIYRPDRVYIGTYTNTFQNQSICYVQTGKTYLYYPGTWKITYSIDDSIEGTKYFWVDNEIHRRAIYEIRNYNDDGSKTTFDVCNVGKESGWVDIIVYQPESITIGGKQVYGHTSFDDSFYIRQGQRKSVEASGTDLTIMINGKVTK
jgi:hypothetical protein